MTNEEILYENDPIYFIENCCKWEDGSQIKLMGHQKRMIESFESNQKTVICNARQVGVTRTTILYLTWYIKYNTNKNIVLLGKSSRLEHTRKCLNKHLRDQDVKVHRLINGKIDTTSTENSIFYAKSLKDVVFYGTDVRKIDACYYDNFAYATRDEQGDFLKQVDLELPYEIDNLIISSTPMSKEEWVEEMKSFEPTHFYTLCDDAENLRNGCNYIHISWDVIQSRDGGWKEKMIEMMGSEEAFNKEYIQ